MTAICGLVRTQGAEDGLTAMLGTLANYGPESWRHLGGCPGEGGIATGVALGAVGAPNAAPLVQARVGGRCLWIAADARLDNPDELRDALGLRLRGGEASTEALILRAYLRWGPACADRLYGDFAFAIWDAQRRRLFCARDALGARPFCYALNAQGFAFASIVDSVLAAPGVGAELDELRVAAHLGTLSPAFNRRTFFQEVRRLAPGHWLAVDAGRIRPVRQRPYWRPESLPNAPAASLEAHTEEAVAQLRRAVRVRLGEGPVGVQLSGGLDSSIIAVLAARELRRQGLAPPPAFCFQPPPPSPLPPEQHKEYERIRVVAAQEDLQVFHSTISPDDLLESVRDDICHQGRGAPSSMLSKAAGEDIRVLLSGLGGDECLSYNGMGHIPQLLLSGRWPSYLAHLRVRGLRPASWTLLIMARLIDDRLTNYLLRIHARLKRRAWPFPSLAHRDSGFLINPEFVRRVPPPRKKMRHLGVRRSQLRWLRFGHLNSRMEAEVALGAHCGLEVRYPLLDRRLVEFALTLPPGMFSGPPPRLLMRRAAGRLLPSEFCRQDKVEFAPAAAFEDLFAAALPAIRRAILVPEAPLARAPYVDLPRLLERLQELEKPDSLWSPQSVMPALGFLDF